MNAIVSFRKCTLTDQELIDKVDKMTDAIYNRDNLKRSDGIPIRHIPAEPNNDYDLLVGELLVRFQDNMDNKKSETSTAVDVSLVKRKDWSVFRNTGLLLFVNQILHVFG